MILAINGHNTLPGKMEDKDIKRYLSLGYLLITVKRQGNQIEHRYTKDTASDDEPSLSKNETALYVHHQLLGVEKEIAFPIRKWKQWQVTRCMRKSINLPYALQVVWEATGDIGCSEEVTIELQAMWQYLKHKATNRQFYTKRGFIMKDHEWQALELFADTYFRNIAIIDLDQYNISDDDYINQVQEETNWVIKYIITPGGSFNLDWQDEPIIFILQYLGCFARLIKDDAGTNEFPSMRKLVELIENDSGTVFNGIIPRGFRM